MEQDTGAGPVTAVEREDYKLNKESNCMEKDEFIDFIKERLSDRLGADYTLEEREIPKLNGVIKRVLTVKQSGTYCAPSFYLEEMYASYKNGTVPEVMLEQMEEVVRFDSGKMEQMKDRIISAEWLQSNTYVRLIQGETNKERKDDGICLEYGDLLAEFYVFVGEDPEGIRCFRLPRKVWEDNRMPDPQSCLGQILENTRRLFPEVITEMKQCIRELEQQMIRKGEETEVFFPEIDDCEIPKMIVISNEKKMNGASVILYPNVLRDLWEQNGDFYLIPSSVHEVILIKDSEDIKEKELNLTIQNVNQTQLLLEEVLSNHAYFYSEATGLCMSKENREPMNYCML